MFKKSMTGHGVKPTDVGGSAKVHKHVGSGSRPTTSKHEIPTTAPKHPHKLARKVPSYMK